MALIDTHTHIYLPEFDSDRDAAIERAVGAGVEKMLLPNIDPSSVERMLEAESKYKGICIPMMGLHPTSVKEDYRELLSKTRLEFEKRKYIAVGEIGIDLYWDRTFAAEQEEVFREQLEIAADLGLPVAIHSREAFKEIFKVLESFGKNRLKGVFHAFTGDRETAEKAVEFGFMIGIGGIITFKNSALAESVLPAGIGNIILETDSPYLAPAPHRGKRNESSYLAIINSRVASVFGITPAESARITTGNAKELFNLS